MYCVTRGLVLGGRDLFRQEHRPIGSENEPAAAPRVFDVRREFPLVRRLPSRSRKLAKRVLTYLPDSHALRLLAHTPRLRAWRRAHAAGAPAFDDRWALYEHLLDAHLPARFAYLEFGCASGDVVHGWAARHGEPEARFFGFDTFTGMPEEWRGLGWRVPAGAWSLDGRPPAARDPRVAFVKGRFQDSLPGFLAATDLAGFDHYVVHVDADLYSSALYVLCMLRELLPRAIVVFDEFDCVLDELRALEDFCAAFGLRYEVLATAVELEKVALRLTAPAGRTAA